LRKPVVGDVDPPCDPGVAPVGNMPEDPVEGADAAGSPDHPQVKADRHHLRRVRPLAMQPVEGIDHIGGEIGGAAEPVGMEKLHVVGVERIRQYQVPLVSDPHEIWQVVIVRVAVVEEAAFLDLTEPGDRVCQPTGRLPVTAFIAASRSSSTWSFEGRAHAVRRRRFPARYLAPAVFPHHRLLASVAIEFLRGSLG